MAGVVYLGHDNELAYKLLENGTAVPTSAFTRMTLRIGKTLIESTNGSSQYIRWNGSTYVEGEIHLILGRSTSITPRVCRAPLTCYDATSSSGVVMGTIELDIRSDPEAT